MSNKILNKQVPLETIVKIANYLEDIKDEYSKKFELEENKNKNIPFGEKDYEYENGRIITKYTIDFQNGKSITESDYNWFVSNITNAKIIKSITLDMFFSYYTKSKEQTINDMYNKANVSLWFRENDINVDIDSENQEKEAHNIYNDIVNIIEGNKERHDKTIKYRKIRMQSFTIAVGIVLSYIIYIVLKINNESLPDVFQEYLLDKSILIFGQWFIAILLGNILSYWYILKIYKPLLPSAKYAGYNYSTNRGNYIDDVEDFREHSEVHIGRYHDAEKRRNTIEKIYKITKWIVLAQIIVSILLYFILK